MTRNSGSRIWWIGTFWCLAVVIGGCVTTEEGNDSTKTVMQGAGLGGVIGGIAGIWLCDGDDKTQCIAAGVFAGTVAGGVLGSLVAKRKKSYASREQAVNEEIAWNREFTHKVQASNNLLKKSIAGYRKQIAKLQNSRKSGKEKRVALHAESKKLKQDVTSADDTLATIDTQLRESKTRHKKYGGNPHLGKEIAALQQERDVLRSHIRELNAMNNSLGV